MHRAVRFSYVFHIFIVLQLSTAHADRWTCPRLLDPTQIRASVASLKKHAIDKILDAMALYKGIPAQVKGIREAHKSGRYRDYANFGEMGLAELGISVRYNGDRVRALATGRPLIVVANHHLGIADGLSLQHIVAKARGEKNPTLLFLASWIQKLLPHAVYGDEFHWGTAIPVEINMPKVSDPEYDIKVGKVTKFNAGWLKTAMHVLRKGGAAIVFPAGHVASIIAGHRYPAGVFDAVNSWLKGFLSLERVAKADIVFAHVDSVNSRAFYKHRKFFGGGDKERVIWFLSEAMAKKNKHVEVYFSRPMSLDHIYDTLSRKYQVSREELVADPDRLTEFMRQYTYSLAESEPQDLDTEDTPQKKVPAVVPSGHPRVP